MRSGFLYSTDTAYIAVVVISLAANLVWYLYSAEEYQGEEEPTADQVSTFSKSMDS